MKLIFILLTCVAATGCDSGPSKMATGADSVYMGTIDRTDIHMLVVPSEDGNKTVCVVANRNVSYGGGVSLQCNFNQVKGKQ